MNKFVFFCLVSILSFCLSGAALAKKIELVPLTEQCLVVTAVFKCNETAQDVFPSCSGGSETSIVATDQRVNQDESTDTRVVIGGFTEIDCEVSDNGRVVCPVIQGLEGTAVIFVEQKGFFLPLDESPEDCESGTTITL